jgi:outer membrane receptor protein involved in Fe transport
LALIYTPIENLIVKGSYFQSFLDATYHVRYSLYTSFVGNNALKPEKVDIYQGSITHRWPALHLTNELNYFKCDYKEVIYRNSAGAFQNAGKIKNWGLEYEIAYKTPELSAKVNATYQEATESLGYFPIQNNMIENIPKYMGSLVVDYAPFEKTDGFLKGLAFNAMERYIGAQYSRWGKSLPGARTDVGAAWITDLGCTYEATDRITVKAHAKNLFDVQYFQGGNYDYPMQQPGLWYMAELLYKF